MFKFVVFCALLWHGIYEISGAPGDVLTDTPIASFPSINSPKINDSEQHIQLCGNPNFHATQQNFYSNVPLHGTAWLSSNLKNFGKQLSADYIVTNGIGAHKLHRRKVTWNEARQICVQEGGHLAIIRTDAEEKIVLQMMLNDTIDAAWIGFHDKFKEGDWNSVLDEPLGETGWARWSKIFTPNPDNFQNNQHCGRIMGQVGGMDDENCDYVYSFICKISTF